MKLTARKSMVAMGTALALSITPVAVPTFAPVATAAVSEASYNQRLASVKREVAAVEVAVANMKDLYNKTKALEGITSDGLVKLNEAELNITQADGYLQSAKTTATDLEGKEANDANYGLLNDAQKALSDAQTKLVAANGSILAARNTIFKCEGATDPGDSNGSSEGSSDGSSTKSFTSSGNRIDYKDGKKVCVRNSDYWSDKLTKIVAILGTIFTLITTVTKISETMMKGNPLAPAAK